MRLDEQLFLDHEEGNNLSTLRIYAWDPPCVSFGYSQEIKKELIPKGWEAVKRPTGGGIVFHNLSEVTYSIVTDLNAFGEKLIPSYIKISKAIVAGLQKLGIKAEVSEGENSNSRRNDLCFSYPAEYEIVFAGRKLVGSAQKRGKRTLLQQGSILVKDDENSYPAEAITIEEILGRVPAFDEIADALKQGFTERLNCEF